MSYVMNAEQYLQSQTCAWDVRTKRVSYETIPTGVGITAICNYGPTATLFTIGPNFTVKQFDLNPSSGTTGSMVATVQHAPANTPPSPPISLNEQKKAMETPLTALPSKSVPLLLSESEASESEDAVMSPLQKIAQEMDQLEEERRDRLGPLSPVSSRGSQSSRSSGSGRAPRYRYDRPSHGSVRSKSSGTGTGTIFSSGTTSISGVSARESISIRSLSSTTSSRYNTSSLRKEVLRSPEETKNTQHMDLFPFTKARLSDVPFRPTELGPERTPDDLRLNMLKVIFGWDNDIDELIRDECELLLRPALV